MIIELDENVDEILVTDDNHIVLMQISRKEFNYPKTRDLINLIFKHIEDSNTDTRVIGIGITIVKINEDSESIEEY